MEWPAVVIQCLRWSCRRGEGGRHGTWNYSVSHDGVHHSRRSYTLLSSSSKFHSDFIVSIALNHVCITNGSQPNSLLRMISAAVTQKSGCGGQVFKCSALIHLHFLLLGAVPTRGGGPAAGGGGRTCGARRRSATPPKSRSAISPPDQHPETQHWKKKNTKRHLYLLHRPTP